MHMGKKPPPRGEASAARSSWIGSAALGAALIAASTIGHAQERGVDIGKVEYLNSCAGCHGFDGKGNELIAGQLNKSIPDLTAVQKNNRGVFPLSRLYRVIDGREAVAAQGPREMPVWGNAFGMRFAQSAGSTATARERESYTWHRILAVIGHISTLQSK
jgi:mono/diheme cytochrome c family protein